MLMHDTWLEEAGVKALQVRVLLPLVTFHSLRLFSPNKVIRGWGWPLSDHGPSLGHIPAVQTYVAVSLDVDGVPYRH